MWVDSQPRDWEDQCFSFLNTFAAPELGSRKKSSKKNQWLSLAWVQNHIIGNWLTFKGLF